MSKDTIGFDDLADSLQNASSEEIKMVYEILGLEYEPEPCEGNS